MRTSTEHPPPPGDDAGFTLVEVVVAMLVFAVTVTGALGIALDVLDVTRSNTHRVAAANLATKQIEATRSMRTLDIPDGVVTRTETVANTTFTVTQDANYVVAGADTSVCQGTGNQLGYKQVTVTVTWPGMGAVAPVRSDTLKAVGVGDNGLDPSRGALAVAVTGATGGPRAGVSVRLDPGGATRVTGADGCAVFVGLTAGTTYTARAEQAGMGGFRNTRAADVQQGVLAGQVTRVALLYDHQRSASVSWAPPAGHAPPAGLPLRYRSSYVSDGAVLAGCGAAAAGSACSSGVPGAVSGLFPTVYDLSAGACAVDPAGRATVDLLSADGTAAVPLGGFRVRVQNPTGVPVAGAAVTATAVADPVTGCLAGTWPLAATGATGESRAALPFGQWTFTTPGGAPVPATATPTAGVVDVVLTVPAP